MPRKKGYTHFQSTRDKIQAAQIINRLVSIGMGEVEATAQQVNALKSLLNKVLPDLQSVEWEGSIEGDVGVRTVNVNGVKPTDS